MSRKDYPPPPFILSFLPLYKNNTACAHISHRLLLAGARLIAIHKTRYYKQPSGLALGPGPFVAALEYASNKEAEVMGKPDKTFYLSAQAQLKCPVEETVIIGDVSSQHFSSVAISDPYMPRHYCSYIYRMLLMIFMEHRCLE